MTFIFSLFLVLTSLSTFAKDIKSFPRISESEFLALSPEIQIRMGMSPPTVEIRGEESLLKNLEFTLMPILPKEYFRTHGVKEQRNNCIVEPGPETPVVSDNLKAAAVKIAFQADLFDRKSKILSLHIPSPFVYEEVTKNFEYELKIGETLYRGKVNLESPLKLEPVLAEILKQYQKISSAVIQTSFPPTLKRVITDICSDTAIEKLDLSQCNDTNGRDGHICEIGSIGKYRVIQRRGWIFAGPSAADPFSFQQVRLDSMTFLGEPYAVESFNKGIIKNGKLTATIFLSDFSGCFGASCGDGVNKREAFVSVDKKGVMSTRIKKHKKQVVE